MHGMRIENERAASHACTHAWPHGSCLYGGRVASAPLDNCLEHVLRLGKRRCQRGELLCRHKGDAGLRVVDDELNRILAQRIIQRHALSVDAVAGLCMHSRGIMHATSKDSMKSEGCHSPLDRPPVQGCGKITGTPELACIAIIHSGELDPKTPMRPCVAAPTDLRPEARRTTSAPTSL